MLNDHWTLITEHWTFAKRSWRRPTLQRPRSRSTIGADRLNDRVRDGNGCGPVALVASRAGGSGLGARDKGSTLAPDPEPQTPTSVCVMPRLTSRPRRDQASRAISTARLKRSRALRSEEHTSELQSPCNLVCRLLLEKKKKKNKP